MIDDDSHRVRLLVADADLRLAAAVCGALNRRGYRAHHAGTAAEALAGPATDLIVLDPALPGLDGPAGYRRLRERAEAGLVLVTRPGRPCPWRADAHLAKPFTLTALDARLRAVLRGGEAAAGRSLTVGPLRLDLVRGLTLLDGVRVELTRKEFQLLAVLARTPSEVVPRQRLASEVWQTAGLGRSRTVDMHVAMLRAKMAPFFAVENRRGVGYRLVQRS